MGRMDRNSDQAVKLLENTEIREYITRSPDAVLQQLIPSRRIKGITMTIDALLEILCKPPIQDGMGAVFLGQGNAFIDGPVPKLWRSNHGHRLRVTLHDDLRALPNFFQHRSREKIVLQCPEAWLHLGQPLTATPTRRITGYRRATATEPRLVARPSGSGPQPQNRPSTPATNSAKRTYA